MPIELNDFHFIRPYLLFLLIPAMFIIYQLRHQGKKQSAWQNIISPHLLAFLVSKGAEKSSQKSRSTFFITGLITLLIILAISGPSFRQKSVPVFQADHAQVILLDLSLSMNATDIQPSRLERAKFKLMDLLNKTKEGTVALVVYAGDAFIISPLTSDSNTIVSMIPTLSTGIMPVLGSRPDIAIDKAIELLQNAKITKGEIIWLTDGVEPNFIEPISSSVLNTQYQLSILAVGTEQGAPIPLPDGNGFLKDSSGSIVIPKLDAQNLTNISKQTKAGFVKLTADNADIEYLQQYQEWQAEANKTDNSNEQMISRWIDDGYWLIWIVLVLFLAKLIKQPSSQLMNVLLPTVLVLSLGLTSKPASALEWKDLWQTKDQQAKQAFAQGEFDKAAELFEEKQWQATSQFKSGQFAEAANNFDPSASTDSLYNHATSLAKAEKLQESLDAYNQLLEKEPNHEDGLFNKQIVEDLLKQQEQQKQDQQKQDQESEEDKNNKDQESQDSESDSKDKKDGEQDQEEKNEEEQQENQESEKTEEEKEAEKQMAEMTKDEREKAEKDQALETWLEKIPDDPGGLLRRKMYREYQLRGREQKEKKLW